MQHSPKRRSSPKNHPVSLTLCSAMSVLLHQRSKRIYVNSFGHFCGRDKTRPVSFAIFLCHSNVFLSFFPYHLPPEMVCHEAYDQSFYHVSFLLFPFFSPSKPPVLYEFRLMIDLRMIPTGTLVTWVIYELSRTPHALKAVRAEAYELFGAESDVAKIRDILV